MTGSLFDGANPIVPANVLSLLIVQILIIIGCTRLLSVPLLRLRQPRVIAEVLTGIILGPSVMGNIPGWLPNLFPPSSLPVLKAFADIGLIFFMFLVGLELDLRSLRSHMRNSLIIAGSGLAVPFAFAAPVGYAMYITLADQQKVSLGSFILFILVSMSITAFPVLARILSDRNLFSTQVGLTAISAAAVGDAIGWLLLALVVSIVSATSQLSALWAFLCGVALTAFLFLFVRRWLTSLINLSSTRESLNTFMIFIVYFLILVCSWITEAIGIHAIFGAFLMGLVIPHDNGFAIQLTEKTEDFVAVLLVPLYFAYSGLRTSLGVLNDGTVWGMVVLVIAAACTSKVLGSAIPTRLLGLSWREAWTVGVLMNTKGLVELIVLNVGLDAGVLNQKSFVVMTIMAIFTTLLTSPIVSYIYPPKYHKYLHTRDPHAPAEGAESAAPAERPAHRRTRSFLNDPTLSVLHEVDALASFVGHKPSTLPKGSAAHQVTDLGVLVCLVEQRSLPGFMSLVQMVGSYFKLVAARPPSSGSGGGRRGSDGQARPAEPTGAAALKALFSKPPAETTGTLAEEREVPLVDKAAEPAKLSVVALRLIAMTDRTSAIMAGLEQQTTMMRDPLLNVFRTFAQINKISCYPSLAVRQPEAFPDEIVNAVNESGAGLVLLPLLPKSALESEMRGLEGWFERQYNTKHPLVQNVLSRCPATIGVFVDNGFGGFVQQDRTSLWFNAHADTESMFPPIPTTPTSEHFSNLLGADRVVSAVEGETELLPLPASRTYQNAAVRILVLFVGGKDDRASVALALRLIGHAGVAVDVVRLAKVHEAGTSMATLRVVDPEDDKMWAGLKDAVTAKRFGTLSDRVHAREVQVGAAQDDLIRAVLVEAAKLRKSDLVICGRGAAVDGEQLRRETTAILAADLNPAKPPDAPPNTSRATNDQPAAESHSKPVNVRLQLLKDAALEDGESTHQSTASITRLSSWMRYQSSSNAPPPSPGGAGSLASADANDDGDDDDDEVGSLGALGAAMVVCSHYKPPPQRAHERTTSARSFRTFARSSTFFDRLVGLQASVLVVRGPMFSDGEANGVGLGESVAGAEQMV